MSIARRILLLAFIPMTVVFGLAGWLIAERISALGEMARLSKGASLIETIDAVTNSLQLERGRTAVFLAAKGSQGGDDLLAQRMATDTKRKAFSQRVDAQLLRSFPNQVQTTIQAASSRLQSLSSLRDRVTNHALEGAEAARAYTEIIESLLAVTLTIVRDTDQSSVKNSSLALNFLQAAKERAGRGRATGAAGVSAGFMSEEQVQTLAVLAGEENEFTKLFLIYAPKEIAEEFSTQVKSEAAREVDHLRQLLLVTPAGQAIAKVDTKTWFDAATARVEFLGHFEDELLQHVLVQAGEANTLAAQGLIVTALSVFAVMVSLSIFALKTMRSITKPLTLMADKLADLAAASLASEAKTKTLMNLDVNINALRDKLYAYGNPSLVDDKLYFGDVLINGLNDIVDDIQKRYGGTATIFCGPRRVATNILQPNGSRATGTMLTAGPAFDATLTNGKTYQGEANILGSAYLTVYEPIIEGDRVIGILYVGVLNEKTSTVEVANVKNEIKRIEIALSVLEKAMAFQAQAEEEAVEYRHLSADRLRRANALSLCVAADQQFVVSALSLALESLAGTDLTHSIEAAFPAEYQNLKSNFGAAVTILRDTIRTISSQASNIFNVTDEISNAIDDLSGRTEQQAASLEETAAALDEITVNIKQTAAGVNHVREVIENTKSDAERSGEVVAKAVAAMGNIQDSSALIGQITGVINEIAFQTNLLALNAGVEAARAGEAGRGFAVVASEVRALAQRSADASKQISTLISTSSQHVEEGVALVGETGAALHQILRQVAEINSIISAISSATQEQTTGLVEVNKAVSQMDQFTQQNAAMVQQSAAASQNLTRETEQLSRLISRFRIENGCEPAVGNREAKATMPKPLGNLVGMDPSRRRYRHGN